MGWQPWATAPEDGTEILAYREDAGVFVLYFVPPIDDDEQRWFTSAGEDLTGDLPTHWMALPEPPEVSP